MIIILTHGHGLPEGDAGSWLITAGVFLVWSVAWISLVMGVRHRMRKGH